MIEVSTPKDDVGNNPWWPKHEPIPYWNIRVNPDEVLEFDGFSSGLNGKIYLIRHAIVSVQERRASFDSDAMEVWIRDCTGTITIVDEPIEQVLLKWKGKQ